MHFLDKVKIKVSAGKGGDGIVSFRREIYVPKGGPDGGDGGDGGDIIFCADRNVNTLWSFKNRQHIVGVNGINGFKNKRHGKNGTHNYVHVPIGTVVRVNQKIIADFTYENQQAVIAKGGAGGRGNARFVMASNQAPRMYERGAKGEEKELEMELKLLSDLGLVGLPNAGKSTIINAITASKSTIADYPFTTIVPQIGVVSYDNRSFVLADLPGIIAGASVGKGLGLQFLKHIERCLVLAYVLDADPENYWNLSLQEQYKMIKQELAQYEKNLVAKVTLVIVNKSDLPFFHERFSQFCSFMAQENPHQSVVAIAGLYKKNLKKLCQTMLKLVLATKSKQQQTIPTTYKIYEHNPHSRSLIIRQTKTNYWTVQGEQLAKLMEIMPLDDANLAYLNHKLSQIGVFTALREHHVQDDDTINIYGYEWTWKN